MDNKDLKFKSAVFDFAPKPPKNFITYLVYDTERDAEVWVTKSLDDLVANPESINLEFFGLHVLNSMRLARGLEPLKQYSVGRAKFDRTK